MFKTSKRGVIQKGITMDEAQKAMYRYAAASTRMQQIENKIESEFSKIRVKHEADLNEVELQKKTAFEMLQTFAIENKAEFFSGKRSLAMPTGNIGFRRGKPRLSVMEGFTWDAITKLLKKHLPDYVRTIEEPAKDKLISDREKISRYLPKVGISVVTDETFFVQAFQV